MLYHLSLTVLSVLDLVSLVRKEHLLPLLLDLHGLTSEGYLVLYSTERSHDLGLMHAKRDILLLCP